MFQISVLFVRRQRSWILSDSRGRRMRKIFTNSSLKKPCLHLSECGIYFPHQTPIEHLL